MWHHPLRLLLKGHHGVGDVPQDVDNEGDRQPEPVPPLARGVEGRVRSLPVVLWPLHDLHRLCGEPRQRPVHPPHPSQRVLVEHQEQPERQEQWLPLPIR